MNKHRHKKAIFNLVEKYFSYSNSINFQPGSTKISVAYPCFDHREVNSALDCLLDLRISQGPKVIEFETNFSSYIGVSNGVAVNSGSSANLLAIAALVKAGYVKKGSEVIVPSATFTTVISPIIQNGLIPVFVDIEEDTYNISAKAIKNAITENTSLIMPVHSLGCPADMPKIIKVANKHKLHVLEDCCEAHGTAIDGKKVGSFGLISCFSFFVAHNMTSGEGGMVLTNDAKLDSLLRSMREFGRLRENPEGKPRFHFNDDFLIDYDERYVFTNIGYNIRMTDIAASLGIEQLKKLDSFNQKRVENARRLTKGLLKHKSIQIPVTPERAFHSFYGYTIVINKDSGFTRKELVNHLEESGIETRAFMGGNLVKHPAYREQLYRISGNLKVTEHIENNAFFIGCHPFIGDDEISFILDVFDSFFI